MTAPMKLAAKLPDTPTVNALAKALSERPLKSRLLVIEVDAPRLQLDVDPLDGDEVRTPIATIQSLAWITDADDCTDVRMAARRTWDSHTPQPELPATAKPSLASEILRHGSGLLDPNNPEGVLS